MQMNFRTSLIALTALLLSQNLHAAGENLSGDPQAIEDAIAMVNAMGGAEVWQHIEQLHFVHEWDFVNRFERYLEHEILDMSGIRSWVKMDSESYHNIRAYSPEHGYWRVTNGEFSEGSDESLGNAMARGPYNLYRLARAIARGGTNLKVVTGTIDGMPPALALVFSHGDGKPGAWVILNDRKEPVIWATTQYTYVFGPLRRFGNLWVPDWATTSDGLVRYEMVSLDASNQPPDPALFEPPSG